MNEACLPVDQGLFKGEYVSSWQSDPVLYNQVNKKQVAIVDNSFEPELIFEEGFIFPSNGRLLSLRHQGAAPDLGQLIRIRRKKQSPTNRGCNEARN